LIKTGYWRCPDGRDVTIDEFCQYYLEHHENLCWIQEHNGVNIGSCNQFGELLYHHRAPKSKWLLNKILAQGQNILYFFTFEIYQIQIGDKDVAPHYQESREIINRILFANSSSYDAENEQN
jgi:Zn-finger protein